MQTVIVTGASRGLGAAIAQLAAGWGANVVLAARSAGELQDVVRKIEGAGGKALAVRGDVSREEDCREIIRQAVEQYGQIDALVNNGGTAEPIATIAEVGLQEWRSAWAVNLFGPVMLIQMALPQLRQSRGRVINITSGLADYVFGGLGAYSTSKAALNHLTRILASEEPQVTALAVRPGMVDTAMQATLRERGKSHMAESNFQQFYSAYESGRLLPPEKPGRAIACLALHAPLEWSGAALAWDEPRVQQLVERQCPGRPA